MNGTTTKRTVAWAAIGLLVGVLAAAALSVPVLTAQIRATQVDNTQKADERDKTLRAVQRGNRLIEDCVRPNGKCYERGQRQTAKAVGDINRVVILAAACASQMPGASTDAIQRCVVEGLEKS